MIIFLQADLLPDGYIYSLELDGLPLMVKFRVQVSTKTELKDWISQFKQNVNWVVRRTHSARSTAYCYQV